MDISAFARVEKFMKIFNFSLEDLRIGEEVATCPSCSLLIRVIYDEDQFADYESDTECLPMEKLTITA